MLDFLEIIGTLFAAVGFFSLSQKRLKIGFILGTLSCLCLIPVFYINDLFSVFCLQLFFICVNINGIRNNY